MRVALLFNLNVHLLSFFYTAAKIKFKINRKKTKQKKQKVKNINKMTTTISEITEYEKMQQKPETSNKQTKRQMRKA